MGDNDKKSTSRPSLLHALLDSDLPSSEKSDMRLANEAQAMVAAGTLTTAHMLTLTTYHTLSTPSVLASLMEELCKAIPDPSSPPVLATLEQLPYLNATMYEGLRMTYGIAHRLQRIAPDRAISSQDWIIPPGTPVGMTSVLIHDNPEIFPDPHTFKPERWLPIESEGQRLQKYLVSFSKGSRNCAGMNLAYAEILIGLAGVFRNFGTSMQTIDTVRSRDVGISHDLFNPAPTKGSTGVKVVFLNKKN